MTATRPRRHGKCAFLALLAAACCGQAAETADPGWRAVIIPAFERPPLHEEIPSSQTAIIAAARDDGHGLFEYATTQGAMRWARDLGVRRGDAWLDAAKTDVRRDDAGVIERILLAGDHSLFSSVALTPAFYRRFEPLLGEGFHVVIPRRDLIALYPRVAGRIPPSDAAALLEEYLIATYPVSREVFRATRSGLVADGILSEE